jgi:NAD(P)-dependent dehydrogenase (short-subunit alcohol dehydrogenase family)
MSTILITGANRGLGLEFARQYAADGWQVLATCRNPADAAELAALPGEIRILSYEALSEDSAQALVRQVGETPIDVLLLNAGTSEDKKLAPEAITTAHWQHTLLTNTFAPFRLAVLLKQNLQRGELKKLVAVSSLAASMSQYDVPREIAYRASKGALNQLWRNLTVEWRDWQCLCLMLRPGKVSTRMTGFDGDLTPEQSVTGMRGVIDGATFEMSGNFYGYDGNVVPW